MPNGKEEKEQSKEESKEESKAKEDAFNFPNLPRDIRQLIFQFFSPDKHKMTDINRVFKEWNTLSKSDFMVLKYCKRTPESGWRPARVDPETGKASKAKGSISFKTFYDFNKRNNKEIPGDAAAEKILYEFKNPAANLKGIEIIALVDGTYSIKFISPKNFEAMRNILENAGSRQSDEDLSNEELSTDNFSKNSTDNFLNALTALKEEGALKQHGIPKIILELVTNDIKQRNALLHKPDISPGK